MKSKILKIFIISILFLIMYYNKSYCVDSGTVRMQILPNDNAHPVWNNITVSESYDECLSLNSTTSTLGTDALRAHLTTDADWSAMAIFSISQYGGATDNGPIWTNNNKSGINNIARINNQNWYTQTTGVCELYKNDVNYSSLLDESGNAKKYVKLWSTNSETINFVNNFVCFSSNGTLNWLQSETRFRTHTYGAPSSTKLGLFGVTFMGNYSYANGGRNANVTFQPVIWN